MAKKHDDQALFVGMLEKYLNVTLHEKFVIQKTSLNRETLKSIKHEIREVFLRLFKKSNFNLSEKTIDFITDEYFMGVNINGTPLHEMLIMNNTTADSVPEHDFDMVLSLFRDTTIGDKLEEVKRKR